MIKRDSGFWWAIWLIAMVPIFGLIINSGILDRFDQNISEAVSLRGEAQASLWATILQSVTWLGDFGPRMAIAVAIALLLYRARGPLAAAAMVITPVISSAYSSIMKWVFDLPRPEIIPHLDHVTSASYPSGHAAGAMVLYALFVFAVPQQKRVIPILIAMVMVGLICWSRLSLGVHWTTDIIGGLMGGLGFALLARPYLATPTNSQF